LHVTVLGAGLQLTKRGGELFRSQGDFSRSGRYAARVRCRELPMHERAATRKSQQQRATD
jgi:hypothetical protein